MAKYGLENKCVITSFRFSYLEKMHKLAPHLELGYLVEAFDEGTFADMKRINCVEFCPEAPAVTREAVEKWHAGGFRVRAWGVKDEALMRQVYDAGADGMTVNFPDKLTAYMKKA